MLLKKQLHTLFYNIRILYQMLVLLTKQQQQKKNLRFYFEMFWAPSKEKGTVCICDRHIQKTLYIHAYTHIHIYT